MFNKNLLLVAAASATVLLSGCANMQMQREINQKYDSTSGEINQQLLKKPSQPKHFVVNKGSYANEHMFDFSKKWARKRVSVHAYQQPLANIMNILTSGTNIKVSYNKDLAQTPVNINYQGSLVGALHQLMMKNNIYFDISNNASPTITWSQTESKVFNVAYMPGDTTFQLGESNKQSGNNQSTPGNGDSSASLKGDTNAWTDVENSVKLLLSSQGKVIVSQSSGTITVIDRPLNVMKISKLIEKFNQNLSKRVTIHIKILEVELDKQHQYGIDWNLVYKGVTLASMSGNTLSSVASLAAGQNSNTSSSKWAGTSGLINALDQQGKTAVIDEPTITTLNNSPSSIAVTDKQAYIKSTEASTTGYGSYATINYSVKPDNIVTGLKMNLIPHIQDGKVYLSIQGSLSSLKKLTSVSYGTQNASSAVQVQLPETTSKDFNQRVMIPNGHVAVLSGLRTSDNNQVGSKNFELAALGNTSQQIKNKELVILIQPSIAG